MRRLHDTVMDEVGSDLPPRLTKVILGAYAVATAGIGLCLALHHGFG